MRPALIAFAVAAACALAFAPSLSASWLYDDHVLIEHNANVHTLAAWPRWLERRRPSTDTGPDAADLRSALVADRFTLRGPLLRGTHPYFHPYNSLPHAGFDGLADRIVPAQRTCHDSPYGAK